jgi:acyl dehydratase
MAGMYYEDFTVGSEYVTSGRTITETDIVQFAALTGDWAPIHTDEEFCKSTPFKTRLAHGLFGVSLIEGLWFRFGYFDGTGLASLGWKISFVKPIFIGDTIRVKVKIASKRETKKPDRGILVQEAEIVNQRDEVVTEAEHTVMIRRK